MAQQQQQQQDERLITALTQIGGLASDVRSLREELRTTSISVQELTKQIIRIEAENSASNFSSRLAANEQRIFALELKEEKREGGKESGANIWKYTTGALALILTALGVIIAYLKLRGL